MFCLCFRETTKKTQHLRENPGCFCLGSFLKKEWMNPVQKIPIFCTLTYCKNHMDYYVQHTIIVGCAGVFASTTNMCLSKKMHLGKAPFFIFFKVLPKATGHCIMSWLNGWVVPRILDSLRAIFRWTTRVDELMTALGDSFRSEFSSSSNPGLVFLWKCLYFLLVGRVFSRSVKIVLWKTLILYLSHLVRRTVLVWNA